MAAVQNPPSRTDWAEDDDQPDLAAAIPPPQITKNKDGTETVVTIFYNEEGKKVRRTQRIRRTVVKKRENQRVAARRQWDKIGSEAGRTVGPHLDTTTLGENIMFRPQVGFKGNQQQEKVTPEEDKKAEALKKMQIKCRICQGDHFTTKCPFKDTMAPEGESTPGPESDAGAGGGADSGLGVGGSSYVPPHLRKGGAATGERMGGKFERDDLATLRVTNVSHPKRCAFAPTDTLYRFQSLPKNKTCARCSNDGAVSPESSLQKTVTLAEQKALRLYRIKTARTLHERVRRWMAMVMAT